VSRSFPVGSREDLGEFIGTDRLRQVRIEAGLLCLATILGSSISGDGHQHDGIPQGGPLT
jgi:hypothetical protein